MTPPIENPTAPSADEILLAQKSCRTLAGFRGQRLTVAVAVRGRNKKAELPATVATMLMLMLAEMAEGNSVRLVTSHSLLTTQQAADILGVSRPFITKQMKHAKIPFRKIGTHRRIAFSDLIKYQQEMAEESDQAMNDLVAQAQELGMGY